MEINLTELWAGMGLPVRMVVILLSIQAVACIAVTIDRLILLTQSTRRAAAFAAQLQPSMEQGDCDKALQLVNDTRPNHLSSLLGAGLKVFAAQTRSGDRVEHAAELTKRAIDRKGDIISRELNRGMNVLASTGSTAPFVGLLGTVLGIVKAASDLAGGGSGQGDPNAVMAGVFEALVATAVGLFVAIPAVVAYNLFQRKVRTTMAQVDALAHLVLANVRVDSKKGGAAVPEQVPPVVARTN